VIFGLTELSVLVKINFLLFYFFIDTCISKWVFDAASLLRYGFDRRLVLFLNHFGPVNTLEKLMIFDGLGSFASQPSLRQFMGEAC
jgi:hypothetical protein